MRTDMINTHSWRSLHPLPGSAAEVSFRFQPLRKICASIASVSDLNFRRKWHDFRIQFLLPAINTSASALNLCFRSTADSNEISAPDSSALASAVCVPDPTSRKTETALLYGQNMNIPVMFNLTSLTMRSLDDCLIPGFLNEKNLPALVNLSLQDLSQWTRVSTHVNMWQPHRGVKSLALAYAGMLRQDDFAETIVQLFPGVKKLELNIIFACETLTLEISQMMEQFQKWSLEKANFVVECVDESAWIVTILKNMSLWKGIKRVHFKRISFTQNDLPFPFEDITSYSAGLASVKFTGPGYAAHIVELKPSVSKESDVPVQLTVAEITEKMQPFFSR
ncbi:uncharacterized protein LOC110855047 [Folsomia candida]|uniref:uncharacterized protein LOC110855047 n=1 Tax=Folsomia candida TaxID=158441 RepID=UPI001604BABA|nr:uncharacterized protein LOC110855047 [Folsomia candida]